MDPLDELPLDSRREVVAAVGAALGVDTDKAEAIVRASEPLWNAMENAGGLVDSWGGGEFCYLFPIPWAGATDRFGHEHPHISPTVLRPESVRRRAHGIQVAVR
jgi:hypothetical protein